MNSTDEGQLTELMGALFDELLLPIAERMRAEGVAPFPLKPDVCWLSYYVRRKRSAMTHEDFSSASCADLDEFAQRLASHWQALGRHELAARAADVASAAGKAKRVLAEQEPGGQSPELSPYVYAMF